MEEIIVFFGSRAELARRLGVERSAVAQWARYGLPPARAIEIERLSEGRFKASDIVGAKYDDGQN